MKALLAAGAVLIVSAGSASAGTVMRIGETGVSSASAESTKTITARQLKRIRALKILVTGKGQVEEFAYNEAYDRVSLGVVEKAPKVTGTWSISCERPSTISFRTSSGTLVGGKAITRRIPLANATKCEVRISGYASGAAEWPSQDLVTVVQAVVTTVPVKKPKRAKR